MNIKLLGSFVKWACVTIWDKIKYVRNEVNQNFRSMIRYETGLGIVAWFLLTLIVTLASAFLIALPFKTVIPTLGIVVASVCYLGYTIFSIAWESFKQDRQQLFENIKEL